MVVFGPEAALTAFREGESKPDTGQKARQGGWESRSGKRRTSATGPKAK